MSSFLEYLNTEDTAAGLAAYEAERKKMADEGIQESKFPDVNDFLVRRGVKPYPGGALSYVSNPYERFGQDAIHAEVAGYQCPGSSEMSECRPSTTDPSGPWVCSPCPSE
jgi:hypothetical protein